MPAAPASPLAAVDANVVMELRSFDLTAPVIATPVELVRKLCQR